MDSNTSRALFRILQDGLLRIRARAYSGQADECGIEADHLHNIPEILLSGSDELLESYMRVDRPLFQSLSSERAAQLAPHWESIGRYLKEKRDGINLASDEDKGAADKGDRSN
jgi:hypothetical protein